MTLKGNATVQNTSLSPTLSSPFSRSESLSSPHYATSNLSKGSANTASPVRKSEYLHDALFWRSHEITYATRVSDFISRKGNWTSPPSQLHLRCLPTVPYKRKEGPTFTSSPCAKPRFCPESLTTTSIFRIYCITPTRSSATHEAYRFSKCLAAT